MQTGVAELLLESLRLMAAGMTIVFAFLLLLVGLLTLMSRLVRRLTPAPSPGDPSSAPEGPERLEGQERARAAAIVAAIAHYRARHPR